jgi:hypothetical protein
MKVVLLITAAFALLLSMTERGESSVDGTPCLVEADSVEAYQLVIEFQVMKGDSSRLAQYGLPYKPAEGVTLVTDSTVCAQAVAGYNAYLTPSDSIGHIGAAYVFRVGSSHFVVAKRGLMVFFDSNFQKVLSIAGIARRGPEFA